MAIILAEKYQPYLMDRAKVERMTEGSIEYRDFWRQQIDRCRNGYKPTGGTWIPGSYYFYINFCQIERLDEKTRRKTIQPPAYRDQDHEYFLEVDLAQKGGYGLIIGKARRKGFSMNNMGIALHEFTFYPGSQCGVASEVETFVKDFRNRTLQAYATLPKEIQLRVLKNNKDILVSGYKAKSAHNSVVEDGYKSMIHWRNMDPTGKNSPFRGLSLAKAFFEEAGVYKNLIAHYEQTIPCFRDGKIQFGMPIIGGTSDQATNTSEDFMKMFNEPKKFNLKAIFIPDSKVYPGYFDYKTGISDTARASEYVEAEAQKIYAEAGTNKLSYYIYRQEHPLKVEHMFMQTSSTPFNLDKINVQMGILNTNSQMRIAQRARLDWPKDSNRHSIFMGKPVLVYDPEGEYNIVEPNLEALKNIHVAGVDPYHLDEALQERRSSQKKTGEETKSNGCMYVYRRFVNTNVPGEYFVAEYCKRPDRVEDFYEACLKLCMYYDCQVLVEANDNGFFNYFIENKAQRYLKERPRAADSMWNTATNRYGIHMKASQKALLIDLMGDYIENHSEEIYYYDLLKESSVFGTKNTDRVIAAGLCLIHDMDATRRNVGMGDDDDQKNKLSIPHWVRENGKIKYVGSTKKNTNLARPGKFGFR